MNKCRVCHVMDHMGLGGAQTIVRDIVDRNENHFIFSLRRQSKEIHFKEKTSELKKFYSTKGKYSILVVKELKKFVENNNIQVLHVHLKKSVLIVYLLKKIYPKLNVKFVFHEHSAICSKVKSYPILVKLVKSRVDSFISVSKECKELLIKKAGVKPDKIEVVYNYANFEDLKIYNSKKRESLREGFGLNKDDFVVGYAGRLRKYKGVSTIIQSYFELCKLNKDKNVKLLIAGNGDYFNELEREAEYNPNIIFLGHIQNVFLFYNAIDVFVLASKSEGNPMTFFESQAYKVPFVGSNIKSICEMVDDEKNGLIFELGNYKDLTQKIVKLKENQKFRNNLVKNSSSILKEYSIDNFEKKIEMVYNNLRL